MTSEPPPPGPSPYPEAPPPPPGAYPPPGSYPPPGAHPQAPYAGPPGPYGGYYGMPVGRTSNTAVAALVLSIVSFVLCPLIPAIVALILVGNARREIRATNGWVTGEGMCTAAKVLSIANLVLSGLALVVVTIGLLAASAGGGYIGGLGLPQAGTAVDPVAAAVART
ncbi:MAG: DUF4190 domain-containing protein [Acidimicrobiales bacterium]